MLVSLMRPPCAEILQPLALNRQGLLPSEKASVQVSVLLLTVSVKGRKVDNLHEHIRDKPRSGTVFKGLHEIR
jgi:hypothetical protein